jgi:hypothetical protein
VTYLMIIPGSSYHDPRLLQWPGLEEVAVTDKQLRDHHEKVWAELPIDLQERAVKAAKALITEMAAGEAEKLKAAVEANPDGWATPVHFFWGMAVRNYFRVEGDMPDNLLPSGNWDDYYVKAIELGMQA